MSDLIYVVVSLPDNNIHGVCCVCVVMIKELTRLKPSNPVGRKDTYKKRKNIRRRAEVYIRQPCMNLGQNM